MSVEPLSQKPLEEPPSPREAKTTPALNQWMCDFTYPYIKGKVMEIGTGNGSITDILLSKGLSFRISDPDYNYFALLQNKYHDTPLIKGIHQIDLSLSDFDTRYHANFEKLDTILILERLETISYRNLCLSNAGKLMKIRGHLIFILPAPVGLYGDMEQSFMEQSLKYWQNLNRQYIEKLLGKDMEIMKVQFFSISDKPEYEFSPLLHEHIISFNSLDSQLNDQGVSMVIIARKTNSSSNFLL